MLDNNAANNSANDNSNVIDRLSAQSADHLPQLFVENIVAIYQYDATEIKEFLLSSHADSDDSRWTVLTTIRQHLLTELQQKFPPLKEKELYKRRKLEIMAHDVYIMGLSYVNNIEDKRLNKVLKSSRPGNETQSQAADESLMADDPYADILETCLLLKTTVIKLEATVSSLSTDVRDLRHQLEVQQAAVPAMQIFWKHACF